jgi:hypothetical protein
VAVAFNAPHQELSQGDLFALAPSLYVKELGFFVRLDRNRYQLQEWQPPTLKVSEEHQAAAAAVRRLAIVLTHDCEIDKSPARASVLLAQVRPLAGVPDDQRQGFRHNTRHRAFYLPQCNHIDQESYADLRAITTIRVAALGSVERIASMNEDGRRMLREQLFRFFTRRYLPRDWPTWPEDPD